MECIHRDLLDVILVHDKHVQYLLFRNKLSFKSTIHLCILIANIGILYYCCLKKGAVVYNNHVSAQVLLLISNLSPGHTCIQPQSWPHMHISIICCVLLLSASYNTANYTVCLISVFFCTIWICIIPGIMIITIT